MKKILLLFVVMLTASLAARADVYINSSTFPDANFRAEMMSLYPSGIITTAQCQARTVLELNNKNISNSYGIQYFPNLVTLKMFGNNLTSIDLTALTKLTELNLGSNKLTSIDLSKQTQLQTLYLHYNNFTTISVNDHSSLKKMYVTGNTSLTGLYCWRDNLTTLDVGGCTALKSLKCYENPNLSSITGIANCTAITWLDVEDCAFTDISFVGNMTKLERLYARNNQITTLTIYNKSNLAHLSVLGNKKLTDLKCYSNALTELNVTNCTALKDLRCYYNYNLPEITGLGTLSALTYLDCDGCAITNLNALNSLANLQTVLCRNNKITSLTITDKSGFKSLYAKGNTSMTTLQCNGNALTTLEVTNCTALQYLYCYNNPNLTSIKDLADCTNMYSLRCQSCALTDLSAITGMTKLVDLQCGWNKLTSLNLSNNTKLVYLVCQNNLLTSLNISACTVLKELYCGGNKLTGYNVNNMAKLEIVDVSNSTSLTTLYAYSNPLMNKLNVTGCTALTQLDCAPSPALSKITGLGDCTALKTLYCYNCILNTLEGINNLTKLEKLYCYGNKLTSLEITGKSNLTYLDCKNNTLLTSLVCYRNNLESLDITGNTALKVLRCFYNSNLAIISGLADCKAITYLDCEDDKITDLPGVNNMTNLETFYARNNKLSGTFDLYGKSKLQAVRLAGNTSLTRINCYNNSALTNLDISGCSGVQILSAYNNKLNNLNLLGCSALYDASCSNNELTSLNLRECTKLKKFFCYNNKLTLLDFSNSPELALLHCYKNNIKGTNMETMINSLPTRMASSPGEFRLIYNSGEGNSITAPQVIKARQKYWIPMRYNGSGWVEIEAQLQGDVNGDGEVNIADVNALIALILKQQSTAAADVNGDNEVNIADVNALIDIILNQ